MQLDKLESEYAEFREKEIGNSFGFNINMKTLEVEPD